MNGTARRPTDEAILSERVRQRTMAARRRRFVRSALLFLGLAAAMVVVSLLHRDAQAVRHCRDRLEYAVRQFSADYKGRTLPLLLPHRPEEGKWVRNHYDYRWKNDQHFGPDRRVGVCCCKRAHRFFMRADGRHVLLFDGQDFQIVWMTEDEFRWRAEDLRLPVPGEQ
jgi:hypothetical protein